MPEEWRKSSVSDDYLISSHGRVKSLKGGIETLMKGSVTPAGYRRVDFHFNGIKKHFTIHRLVAISFLGDKSHEGLIVCHEDGDQLNNNVSNLRWDTHSSNMKDKVIHGTHHLANKEICIRGHPLLEPNLRPREKEWERECLACARARTNIRDWKKRYGFDSSECDFLALSNEHYNRIIQNKKGKFNARKFLWG